MNRNRKQRGCVNEGSEGEKEEKGKKNAYKIVPTVKKNMHEDKRDWKEESEIQKWWQILLVKK